MRPRVLIATANPAKQQRLRWLLRGSGLAATLPDPAQSWPRVPEDASSHAANARAKAIAWSRAAGGLAIASDGGMAIPALGDRWDALRTRRFAGPQATDAARTQALLRLMAGLRGQERSAWWIESVCLANRGHVLHTWSADSPRGTIAATYDPAKAIAGFWAFSLWIVPPSRHPYAELSPRRRARVDDHWSRLRAQVQRYFATGHGARLLRPLQ
ncbi:MAG: hypothetical protein EXR49_06715 [Dehalococcoidia bacterium]|nr:hypothetical protein [Dehalococcoidia bacterium]